MLLLALTACGGEATAAADAGALCITELVNCYDEAGNPTDAGCSLARACFEVDEP